MMHKFGGFVYTRLGQGFWFKEPFDSKLLLQGYTSVAKQREGSYVKKIDIDRKRSSGDDRNWYVYPHAVANVDSD